MWLFSALSCSKSGFGMKDIIGHNCWAVLYQLSLEELDLFLCSFILVICLGFRWAIPKIWFCSNLQGFCQRCNSLYFLLSISFFSFSGCNELLFLVGILLLFPELPVYFSIFSWWQRSNGKCIHQYQIISGYPVIIIWKFCCKTEQNFGHWMDAFATTQVWQHWGPESLGILYGSPFVVHPKDSEQTQPLRWDPHLQFFCHSSACAWSHQHS